MQTLYEFRVSELCKKYSYKALAEMVLALEKTVESLTETNSYLRKENDTLMFLIARERIGREEKQNE